MFIGDSLGVNIFDLNTLSTKLWDPKNVNINEFSNFYSNMILMTNSKEDNFVVYDMIRDEVTHKAANEKLIYISTLVSFSIMDF